MRSRSVPLGTEDERRLLAMKVGELALKLHERMIRARNIARPTGARPHPCRDLDHCANHFRMLAHAEIIVGAPDHDLTRALR